MLDELLKRAALALIFIRQWAIQLGLKKALLELAGLYFWAGCDWSVASDHADPTPV